jgi:crotonobetainyl-CoA:carnitine CoA-transferase CaiB-like acyl-CoA transferase
VSDGTSVNANGGENRSAPLEGLLVADFSRVLAGPFATMLLGDFGATVIKVERPEGGDDTRSWGPPFDADGVSTYYQSINRNKQSVRLDLRDSHDLVLARELADRSDVLVENFRPGTMDTFGLGYSALVLSNPRIIYCSVSGFGQNLGKDLPGYDFLAQAAGGLMSITGSSGEPTKTGVAVGDVVTGLFSVIGILMALIERAGSGRGQKVDTNLMHSVLGLLVNHASAFLIAGDVAGIQGNAHSSIAPYETVQALDGIIVIAVGNDRQFEKLCGVLDLASLATDPDYAINSARVKNRETLHDILEQRICAMSVEHWTSRFAEVGVPTGKINAIDEAFAFAETLGLAPTYTHLLDGAAAARQVSNPITLSESSPTYRLPPPRLGEHDEDVRRWLAAPRE